MLLIWASRFLCRTCNFFFTCPVGKWIFFFFFNLSAPVVTVILHFISLEYLAKLYKVMCSVVNEKSSLKIMSLPPHILI